MLRRTPARTGRSSYVCGWPNQETAPSRPLQDHQPAVESPVPRRTSLLGGARKGKEKGARADVPQLRLSPPAIQGSERKEGQARRRVRPRDRLGEHHFLRPPFLHARHHRQARSLRLCTHATACSPDHPDPRCLHAVVSDVAIARTHDQSAIVASRPPVRFRARKYCSAPLSIGYVPC